MLSIRMSRMVGNWRGGVWPALAALCALALGVALGGGIPAAAAAQAPPPGEVCPLANPVFKARLNARRYTVRVGETAHLRVRLTPSHVPDGFFVTCLVDPVAAPPGQKPAILTGFPVSDVTPRAAGAYRLRVLVNLIAKSSCGGVKAVTLLDQEVELTAR